MPTLRLSLCPPQKPERHARLAQVLTALTADLLHKRPEVTAVLMDECLPGRWTIGGVATDQPTALLEISITAGTNTDEEKAAFIAAAFRELQAELAPGGELAPASYVIVRELAAGDWGYGGLTQRARQQARTASTA